MKALKTTQPLPRVFLLIAAVALAALSLDIAAADPEVPRTTPQQQRDFASFRIIAERNIFNPNRSARQQTRSSRTDTRRPAARVDSFTFVGTINYEKGVFAFFDSPSADFRKVIQQGSRIAGLELTEVDDYAVKLSSGTNTFDLRIGMQMRREEEGQWRLASSGEPAPTQSAVEASESGSEASSSGVSDILKRLMQKREQELK
jgi:hypothetical protein